MNLQKVIKTKKEIAKKNPFDKKPIHNRTIEEQANLQKNKIIKINKFKNEFVRNKSPYTKKIKNQNFISKVIQINKIREKSIKNINQINLNYNNSINVYKNRTERSFENIKNLNLKKDKLSNNNNTKKAKNNIFKKFDLNNKYKSTKENLFHHKQILTSYNSKNDFNMKDSGNNKFKEEIQKNINNSNMDYDRKILKTEYISKNREKNYSIIINTEEMNITEFDKEFGFAETIPSKNLEMKKFPKLSKNPFSSKFVNSRFCLKSGKISKLKKNIFEKKNNNNNNIDNNSLSNSKDSKYNHKKDSNDISFTSNSTIKSNTIYKFSDDKKIEQIYKRFLLLSKRGDNKKFLDFFNQIISLPKKISININYQDKNGNTALHYASNEGNLKIVKTLLGAKCDTNIKNNNNQTPLHLSSKKDYFDITKKLIESGAKLNIEDSEKNTPLHLICKNNNVELLRYVLTKSPLINSKNIYGKTPRDLATNSKIKNLLDKNIKMNEDKFKSNKKNKEKEGYGLLYNLKDNIKKDNYLKDYNQNKNEISNYTAKTNNGIEDSINNKKSSIAAKKNKNLTIKNNVLNSLISLYKKKDCYLNNSLQKLQSSSNTYLQNTNHINNNISINFYSIKTESKIGVLSPINCKTYKKIRMCLDLDEQNKNNDNSQNYNINTNKLLTDKNLKNISNFNEMETNKITQRKNHKKIQRSNKFVFIHNNKISDSKIIKTLKNKQTEIKYDSKPKKEYKHKSSLNLFNNFLSNINRNNPLNKLYLSHNDSTELDRLKNGNELDTNLIEHISPKDFLCLAKIGKGSFGVVYLVEKINTKEKFAMKVLNKEKIVCKNLLKYAYAERNILSNNNHPFIVKLNYAFQTSEKLFLIIEYCPNGDLSKHLIHEKIFKEPRAKFYICELILALEYLHKKDIIFRDLKPDNVLLDKDGHCKLIDFGLSKEGISDNDYTKSFCGSVGYLAPEIILNQGHGKSVDWYLLGVLFYEMIIGTIPNINIIKGKYYVNNIKENIDLKFPNFISKDAADLIKKLLVRNPDKRLGSGNRDALEIKEHPYFKDVNWKKIYEKKINPPNFLNYTDKHIKYYSKKRKFLNENLYETNENPNKIKGWSFIGNSEI